MQNGEGQRGFPGKPRYIRDGRHNEQHGKKVDLTQKNATRTRKEHGAESENTQANRGTKTEKSSPP